MIPVRKLGAGWASATEPAAGREWNVEAESQGRGVRGGGSSVIPVVTSSICHKHKVTLRKIFKGCI